MRPRTSIAASDLFVVLEKAFRRRTRGCVACTFTLPFRIDPAAHGGCDWAIVMGARCSERCRLDLEQLVSEHQAVYSLR